MRGERNEQALVRPRRPVAAEDARGEQLRLAVHELRRALAGYPPELPDRQIADEELAALAAMAAAGECDAGRLRSSLLLVVGALGSISALAGPLFRVRAAVGLFGVPSVRR
ncbi:DUF5955 family protein [Streptomyces sp. 549]|uniref:DUF5955 family protein n=1 Tax=Streptomyces sp. 549 TaxID=3049076 RepID=UPI0024C3BC56|nr:DUF5955 family protein [Streptomyces sp. 549]MDK1472198.1 DUF5955 family protein [Streptomyces sp. 549]